MQRDPAQLTNQEYDCLIIGGGIYGATIAWEATLRGLSVALVERGDFGAGTSANSQRIVHGGLRYLQSLDIARSRESIRERRTLLGIAPHLVHPLPVLMPTYGHGRRSRTAMTLALLLNEGVSRDRNIGLDDPGQHLPSGRVISKAECLRMVPDLHTPGLTGGALWYDAQMCNSERLTLSFILTAAQAGAVVANYVEAQHLLRQEGRVVGVQAVDHQTGRTLDVHARVVVNATGPAVTRLVRPFSHSDTHRDIRFLKAINIVTPRLIDDIALGIGGGSAATHTPGLLFITPWHDTSIIGTAYYPYEEDANRCEATEEEIQALIDEVNTAYPASRLTRQDVRWVHAGLLPAARQSAKLETRDRVIDEGCSGLDGLISVVGVKYTTARSVAEKTVDLACAKLGPPVRLRSSLDFRLHGGHIECFEQFLIQEIHRKPHGLSATVTRHLVHSHGTAYKDVLHWLEENPLWGATVQWFVRSYPSRDCARDTTGNGSHVARCESSDAPT